MGEKKISTEKIKAVLSMASLFLLTIQHFIGVFAESIQISYIPLSITFFTIFINTLGEKELKAIKWLSLIGFLFLTVTGSIVYTMNGYGIQMSEKIGTLYEKCLFFIIGIISLGLCILYVKRICEIE